MFLQKHTSVPETSLVWLHSSAPVRATSTGRLFSFRTAAPPGPAIGASRTLPYPPPSPRGHSGLAWLAGQWKSSPSGKAGGVTGPGRGLGLARNRAKGPVEPFDLPLLSMSCSLHFLATPKSGGSGPREGAAQRVGWGSELGQDPKMGIVSPAEQARHGC